MGHTIRYAIFCVLFGASVLLSGCEKTERLMSQQASPIYSECLQHSMTGGNNLSADDIRSLCAEATGTIEPSYEFKDKELAPSNEFTRCYDKEKKELESKGVLRAARLAKLSCKYPEVKP